MIVYEMATKGLDTESFPQHTIADLNSGITFTVLFSQEKPLRWKEIDTHTHTHTLTHTHTHTQCVSTMDNAGLNLSVYHLTTLTRWIGKRINKLCRMFLLLIKLRRRIIFT